MLQKENGMISENDYKEMSEFYTNKIAKNEFECEEICNQKMQLLECADEIKKQYKKYFSAPELTRSMFVTFIEKVEVFKKIRLKFILDMKIFSKWTVTQMARKSRKNPIDSTEKINFKIYKTAIYTRLSKENQNGEKIETQIEEIKNYIENRRIFELVDIYADNGYSGTNFQRP